jgi:antitoxin PrlF
MTHTSKLTEKYQATVPTTVRKALKLAAGDLVGFEVFGTEVRLSRVKSTDLAFTQALGATLEEWSSKKDDEAFKNL